MTDEKTGVLEQERLRQQRNVDTVEPELVRRVVDEAIDGYQVRDPHG